MSDARYLAVKLLCKTFSSGSYSNIQLNSAFKSTEMNPREKKLCSALYYGVIERKLTLDHIISGLSSRPLSKLDDPVLNILRCGIFQILYMDGIPDNAAVNESVDLAKAMKKTSASGMINAILRNFIRSGKKIKLPIDEIQRASVKYSAPCELVTSLTDDYGREYAENLLEAALGKPDISVRRNPLKCTEKEFIAAIGEITAEKSEFLECCYHLDCGDPAGLDAFRAGFFHVQDLSSQLCCAALDPSENDLVLDICAAPGGKTFTMAEMMNGKGRIYAFDLHDKRVRLIRDGAERLGLTNIAANAGDASEFNPELPEFTKILCDVPCSGIGVIGRKPEIKYKNISDFSGLPSIQYAIADNAVRYLAPGGEMVYSTCTLRRDENDKVCDRLLSAHPELEPCQLGGITGKKFGCRASIFPMHFGSDGFFIAKFRKIR